MSPTWSRLTSDTKRWKPARPAAVFDALLEQGHIVIHPSDVERQAAVAGLAAQAPGDLVIADTREHVAELALQAVVRADDGADRAARAGLGHLAQGLGRAGHGRGHGAAAVVHGLDRVLAHPFVAYARAAFAENAPLRIVRDDRRKILLGSHVLIFREPLLDIAPVEDHFLQFALAAAIANRAVERVVRE